MEETRFDSQLTRCRALCRALGKDEQIVLDQIQNQGIEMTMSTLESYRIAARLEYGSWMRDYVDLRSYVELVDLCKCNPEEQRKAYTQLIIFIKSKIYCDQGFSKWEYTVKDPAFGNIKLFEEGWDENNVTYNRE